MPSPGTRDQTRRGFSRIVQEAGLSTKRSTTPTITAETRDTQGASLCEEFIITDVTELNFAFILPSPHEPDLARDSC